MVNEVREVVKEKSVTKKEMPPEYQQKFMVSANVINSVITYLAKNPYEQVAPIIESVRRDISPVSKLWDDLQK